MQSCDFIPLSEVGLSEDGLEIISGNSNVTFGDANRTLFTVERLMGRVDFSDEDKAILKALGSFTYIDLEN